MFKFDLKKMSYSPNRRNKKDSNKDLDNDPDKDKTKNQLKLLTNSRTYSPTNNIKLITNNDTNSTKNTTAISFANKIPNSYPLKENKLKQNNEKNFISKKKKNYQPNSISNYKKISFQRQKDEENSEFPLFDDNKIFKDINKAYLQDEYSDDGNQSSEEKIKEGIQILSQELEESIQEMRKNLKKNQNKQLLSRKMRFKNQDNK